MSDKGFMRRVASHVGNLPTGSIVTVDEIRNLLGADVRPQTAPATLAELARGDDPAIVRERVGVYRVRRGRRGGGRPAGAKTQMTPAADLPPTPPVTFDVAAAVNRVRDAVGVGPLPVAPQQDPAPMLLLELVKPMRDGSCLYNDEDGNVYKVVCIA